MDRNRAPAEFHGDDPPVYKDPDDVETNPIGTFQTDPTQPQTSLTAEHINLITEEIRNTVIAMGLTPSSEDDTQLSTLTTTMKDVEYSYSPSGGHDPNDGTAFTRSGDSVTVFTAATDGFWNIPINFPVGTVIKKIKGRALESSTGPSSAARSGKIQLFRNRDTGLGEDLGDVLEDFPASASTFTEQETSEFAVTIEAGWSYAVRLRTPGNYDGVTFLVTNVTVTVDLL
jgi:hypothetical protein